MPPHLGMAVAGYATRQARWATRRCATAAGSVARSLHRYPASDVLAVLLRYDRIRGEVTRSTAGAPFEAHRRASAASVTGVRSLSDSRNRCAIMCCPVMPISHRSVASLGARWHGAERRSGAGRWQVERRQCSRKLAGTNRAFRTIIDDPHAPAALSGDRCPRDRHFYRVLDPAFEETQAQLVADMAATATESA